MESFFSWVFDEEMRTTAVCKVPGEILGYGDGITPYLEELGLIKIIKKAQWNGRREDFFWEIEILPLLQAVAELYEDVCFEEEVYWDKDERIQHYFKPYLEKLMPEEKSSPLLKLFEPIEANCPEQTIDLDVRIRGYDCVRVLRLNLSDSLYSLHNMIQKAFNFDDDHLFEFYLGRGIFRKTYTIPEGQTSGEELSVYETKLGDMGLGKGQTFSYLFDFGDSWWFDIKVLQIAEGKVEAPAIIKAENKPPRQY